VFVISLFILSSEIRRARARRSVSPEAVG
jgi:hypothetical protein